MGKVVEAAAAESQAAAVLPEATQPALFKDIVMRPYQVKKQPINTFIWSFNNL
jgi:hypothetical protein